MFFKLKLNYSRVHKTLPLPFVWRWTVSPRGTSPSSSPSTSSNLLTSTFVFSMFGLSTLFFSTFDFSVFDFSEFDLSTFDLSESELNFLVEITTRVARLRFSSKVKICGLKKQNCWKLNEILCKMRSYCNLP
jgi:hypothetical protein